MSYRKMDYISLPGDIHGTVIKINQLKQTILVELDPPQCDSIKCVLFKAVLLDSLNE